MGTRRRLGVALLLDPPAAPEIDGLRRALGDPGLGRIPPHLTLVSPVNVRKTALPAALAVLRQAASSVAGPLTLTLGPPASFRPDNPVVYLDVGGDLPGLRVLHQALQRAPLLRSPTWPWVPHVTLVDGAEDADIDAALVALRRYAAVTTVDRVVLLEEVASRNWSAVADAALGPAIVVGRGGLGLELGFGRIVDPEARTTLREAGASSEAGPTAHSPIVVTARREGEVVAVGGAWLEEDGGHVAVFVVPSGRRQGVGSAVLAQLESATRMAGWDVAWLAATGPAAFYRARSSYSKATEE